MGVAYGSSTIYQATKGIVQDGLVLNLDAGVKESYNGGTTWRDLAGGNNGTLTNMTDNFDSANGGSLTFDGSNEIVNIGSVGTEMYSAGCWVYLNSTITSSSSQMQLFQYGETGNTNPGITFGSSTGYMSGETLTILSRDGNPGAGQGYKRTGITANIAAGWNYITFNWNGSHYDILINSISKSLISSSNAGHSPLVSLDDLVLGYGFKQENLFTGRIACFSVYNRALTATEVAQNFNVTRHRFGI